MKKLLFFGLLTIFGCKKTTLFFDLIIQNGIVVDGTGTPIIVNEIFEVWQTEKVDAFLPTVNLEEYIGEYYSVEADVSYSIQVEEKQLVVMRNNKKIKTLFPVSKDVFGNQIQGYQFTRESGKISGFLIQDRRVRNLKFTKKKHV